jgi:soluble lytic murein transglycosylase
MSSFNPGTALAFPTPVNQPLVEPSPRHLGLAAHALVPCLGLALVALTGVAAVNEAARPGLGAGGAPAPTDAGVAGLGVMGARAAPEIEASPGTRSAEPAIPKRLSLEDLLPHFASGGPARAKVAFDRGDPGLTLRLLKGEGETAPVRFLRALARSRLGDAGAAPVLAELVADYPSLRGLLAWESGRAYERDGKLALAARQYADVPRESQSHVAARRALSRVLGQQREFARAITALASLTEPGVVDEGDVRASAWLGIADLSRRAGLPSDERRALLALWASEPLSHEATQARARLGRAPIPERWTVLRAETLASLGRSSEARRLLERPGVRSRLPDPLACRAQLVLGTALRRERRNEQAVEALTAYLELCPADPALPRALITLAAAQTSQDPTSALETYGRLAKDFPQHPLADDALLAKAQLRREGDDVQGAVEDLAQLGARYPRGGLAAEALLAQAWLLRAAGAPQDSLDALSLVEALPRGRVTLVQRHQARYWRSRALEALGRDSEARALLEEVATEGGLTYYGFLARERLAKEGFPPVDWGRRTLGAAACPAGIWPLELGSLADDLRFRSAVDLMRLGHPAGPLELLLVDRKRHGPEGLRVLFHVFEAFGRKDEARFMARLLVREWTDLPPLAETRYLCQKGYSDSFSDLIGKFSRTSRLDPNLLQAIVREESGFNPRARSGVGARGLAQLMPGTADEVARRLRIAPVGVSALFEPRHNLRLGAAYLATLHRQFEGRAPFAVASYNAGPNAVRRWLRERPTADLDEWVEEIPFEETRNYVKRVLGSYGTYQLLGTHQVEPREGPSQRSWSSSKEVRPMPLERRNQSPAPT